MLSNRSQAGSFKEQLSRDCHNLGQADHLPYKVRSLNISSAGPQPRNHLNMFANRSLNSRLADNRRAIREARSSENRRNIREAQSSDGRQSPLSRYYPLKHSGIAVLENPSPPAYESLYQNLESTTDSAVQIYTDSPQFDPTPPPTYQDYIQNLNETVIWCYLRIS